MPSHLILYSTWGWTPRFLYKKALYQLSYSSILCITKSSKWPRGNYFYSSWEEKKKRTKQESQASYQQVLTMHSLSPCIQWCIQLFSNQITGGEEIPKFLFCFKGLLTCVIHVPRRFCVVTLCSRLSTHYKGPWSRHECLITPAASMFSKGLE